LRRPNPQLRPIGGNEAVARGIDDGEFAGSEGEGDILRGVRVEMDALEAGESANGRAVNAGMGDVEFGDFVAGEGGGVGDTGRESDRLIARNWSEKQECWRAARANRRPRTRINGVGEGGVGEAEAEGEEGSFRKIAIGAVEHGVVGEGRELGDGFVERDGETTGGIVVAGENIRDGGAALFTRIPSFENRGSVLVGPIDGDGAAGCQHNN